MFYSAHKMLCHYNCEELGALEGVPLECITLFYSSLRPCIPAAYLWLDIVRPYLKPLSFDGQERGVLEGVSVERITFVEVTRAAVLAALAAPRPVSAPLVDAYLARRALDYLFGYTLSPLLWRKLPGARSAGARQLPSAQMGGMHAEADEQTIASCAEAARLPTGWCPNYASEGKGIQEHEAGPRGIQQG